ncbi:hypothetical protein APC83_11255 [Acinetobacter baumannii]|uniref:hypothetical protein n=1 Tax=Acinetobacter baumannii TaxID=470 RepID=UPI00070DF205|nr:hypothetical protein [Acinetobacter baumannii]KRJ33606.1 hypothetical protein APC83_11255 [Acinetobacter baumannii]
MKPEQFIREFDLDKARDLLDQLHKLGCPDDMKITVINGMWQRTSNGFTYPELKRLVDSVDLVNNCGGLAIANKITFQKRLRNEKATHFIQHPENQKLIQLLGRNQRKPKEAIKFDLFEQAIHDHETIYGGGDETN